MKHGGINAGIFTSGTHSAISLPTHGVRWLFNAGWMGVDLFFVLSGFLITGILVDTAGHTHYYRNFIVRRALRIFPLYYSFLLITFASSAWLLRDDILWFATYLGNLHMFLKNSWPSLGMLAPLWSLQVEEQFYLTFPWIVLETSRKTLTRVLIGAVAVALLLRIAFQYAMPDNNFATYTLMPCRMDALAMGGLVALALRTNPATLKHWLILPLTIVSALAFAIIWRMDSGALNSTIDYTFLDLTFAGVLILVITDAVPPLTAICRLRPLVGLGAIAYGLYMLQLPMFEVVNRWDAPLAGIPGGDFIEMLFCCAAAILAAILSWRFFESPFLKLKDQFTVQ
jgi:peptidoglycan/LPS O-acetylase OafA/YrhL